MKTCSNPQCEKTGARQSLDQFTAHKGHTDGLSSWCKSCKAVACRAYHIKNREALIAARKERHSHNKVAEKEARQAYRLKNVEAERARIMRAHRQSKYGLSDEQFHVMLDQQLDHCLACHREFRYANKNDRPHVDHHHSTGEIRGLICGWCNIALGLLGDSAPRCFSLGRYVAHADLLASRNIRRRAAGVWPFGEGSKAGIKYDSLHSPTLLPSGRVEIS